MLHVRASSVSYDLGNPLSHSHHLQERLARQAPDRLVPAHQGLHELELSGDLRLDIGRRLAIRFQLVGAFLQEFNRRIELTPLASLHDDSYHLPRVALRDKEVAAVT